MSDYIEVLDETDPGSNLVGDTLIHTDMTGIMFVGYLGGALVFDYGV